MLEVQDAKPLNVQKNKYGDLYFKNDEFFCKINNSGAIHEDYIIYAPKCDFETYMYTWKNKTLANYLRTSIQFYGHLHPDCTHIVISDRLSISCGRNINVGLSDGCAQYFYLSNFTLPFFKQTWLVRYMNAVESHNQTLDLSILDEKHDIYWIMLKSHFYDNHKMLCDKYADKCNSTLHDFFKTFSKRSRFRDSLPWMPGFIHHILKPIWKEYNIPIYPNKPNMYESLHVEEVEIDYYNECPHFESSKDEIVIRNSIIATTILGFEDL